MMIIRIAPKKVLHQNLVRRGKLPQNLTEKIPNKNAFIQKVNAID